MAHTDTPQQESERVPVLTRLPRDVAEWLRDRADREKRSQSRMVEVLLQEAMTEEAENG